MKKYVKVFPSLIGILVLGACSQYKGYKVEGSAPSKEFEGKMVYVKDASTEVLLDSAKITDGKFSFADTMVVENPTVKILSVHTSKMGLEYRLPIVIENGIIKASIADVVCTEGTALNDRMQDFLMAIDTYSESCTSKSVEQIKTGFSDLLKKHIETNKDNVVGAYIQEAYKTSL